MRKSEFQNFYEEYLNRIYRYIFYRVGGQKEIAEDLTAEVFMSALEHVEDLDAARYPGAWLFTAARNRLKNYYRDRRPTVDLDGLSLALLAQDGRTIAEQQHDANRLDAGRDQY